MSMTIYQKILKEIDKAERIVITAHKSPDGDSIGSSMGLYQYIRRSGKEVTVCHPDPYPNFLSWVKDVNDIVCHDYNAPLVREKIREADLIFALDYNDPSRLGPMGELLKEKKEKIIMIDHHLHPKDFYFLGVSDTDSCSTAQLVYELIAADSNQKMDTNIGTPLYLGIMTDTGSFRFSSVQPRTHEILADLLKSGVAHTHVHEQVYDQNSLSQLKLKSFAINQKLELIENDKVAIISLTKEDLLAYYYQKGDTEGLVNAGLSIKGVKMAIFLVEKEEGIKMSFRSKHNLAVNVLASENFEGGGHAYAAGGISHLSMDETLEKLKRVIPNYL